MRRPPPRRIEVDRAHLDALGIALPDGEGIGAVLDAGRSRRPRRDRSFRAAAGWCPAASTSRKVSVSASTVRSAASTAVRVSTVRSRREFRRTRSPSCRPARRTGASVERQRAVDRPERRRRARRPARSRSRGRKNCVTAHGIDEADAATPIEQRSGERNASHACDPLTPMPSHRNQTLLTPCAPSACPASAASRSPRGRPPSAPSTARARPRPAPASWPSNRNTARS